MVINCAFTVKHGFESRSPQFKLNIQVILRQETLGDESLKALFVTCVKRSVFLVK